MILPASFASFPARDGDEGSLGEVGRVRAVLFRPLEVARLDDGGGEFSGLRDVRASPRSPYLAGLSAVGLCGGVTKLLKRVTPVVKVLRPVGREFEFAGADLGAVLLALQFADAGDEPVGGAVEALCLRVKGVDEAPEEARPLIRELRSIGRGFGQDTEGLEDGGGCLAFVPHGAVVELVRPGRGAEEFGLLAYHGGEGFVLRFVFRVLVHDHLLVVVCGSHRSLPFVVLKRGDG